MNAAGEAVEGDLVFSMRAVLLYYALCCYQVSLCEA